ncbi:MAG: thiamine phosphate synthase [Oscillospiraceae bacterium]|nr:thiamine phosphate synthase [Oscillospiraceae bacterium]
MDLTLYLVTNRDGLTDEQFLHTVDRACAGGVTIVQLREKECNGSAYLVLAQKVKAITDMHNVPLIIDDRIDIAIAVDAAGVHLGREDMPVKIARRLMGESAIIGATTKTVLQAEQALAEGASYLGVGAIFPTTTKVKTVLTKVSTLDAIAEATGLPIVAIGGLNAENLDILRGSRANGAAVVTAIMKSQDAFAAAKALRKRIAVVL